MTKKHIRRFRVRYDWVMFALLMLFLFASIIQKQTGFLRFRPLGGVIVATPKPQLSLETYQNNTYQKQLEQYASENFGLREPVIRIYNQYLWSAFRKTYCHFIVPGKHNYLYYKAAVDDYYGTEVSGHIESYEEAVRNVEAELELMHKLRDILKGYGIEFLAFIAPDKPVVYPEFLPRQDADITTLNVAEYFDRRMTETGFPHINMTSWFVAMRDTVSFPLFPKTDSHWGYSAIYGYDSLFRFMSALGEPDFPKLRIGPPVAWVSDKPEGDEETLNLLFRIPGDEVKYKSEITVEPDTCQRKPRVLFVGDSFIWSMENYLPIRELMDEKEIWFYNSSAYMGFDKTKADVKEINALRHILKADYVVFYAAGHQWHKATFGFTKDALRWFAESSHEDICKILTTNKIECNKDWLMAMKMYAFTHELPLEDVLGMEADNVLENRCLLRESVMFDSAVFIQIRKSDLIRQWQSDPTQMKHIEDKAKAQKLPFEEMLERDVQWVVEQQLKNKQYGIQ